jgi:glycosyltransferase involved in cell wall biosynthesis
MKGLPYRVETVFVDSASTDDTLAVARTFFDRICVLKESPNLCASAARYVATRAATGRWLLYLDGDMELCGAFLDLMPSLRELDDTHQGWAGIYRDVFPDGASCEKRTNFNAAGVVRQFGGAVLLPRDIVVRAGNWNPAVFSNEEIDLYTRMRGLGGYVLWRPVPMVVHRTERVAAWQVIVGNVIPRVLLGKRCYGFGQILAARLRNGGLGNFIRWYPVPFFCWASTLASVAAGLSLGPLWGIAALAAGLAVASALTGWRRALIFNLQLVHAVMGPWHYDPDYLPEVISTYPDSGERLDERRSA